MDSGNVNRCVKLIFRLTAKATADIVGSLGVSHNIQLKAVDAETFLIGFGWDDFVPLIHPHRPNAVLVRANNEPGAMVDWLDGEPNLTNISVILKDSDLGLCEALLKDLEPTLPELCSVHLLPTALPPVIADE